MNKFIVFLRGINVNGIKIKMIDLKKYFSENGYNDIITVLATGNIIMTTEESFSINEHKSKIEKLLSDKYNYDAHVIIKSIETLEDMVKYQPLKDEDEQVYVLITEDLNVNTDLLNEYNLYDPLDKEAIYHINNIVYWKVKKGDTLNSRFGKKVLGAKKYKTLITSRNINTVVKIHNKI